jgi:hypothetical protein
LTCELSRKHFVKEVISHVLTLYKGNKDLRQKVGFKEELLDLPEAFSLRLVDDDSEDSEMSD